ncbi:unnamed protein product [Closterium sp. Naga37s-1]|nr:unnamed protein product [Closterium sp. Naga37s-1]
MANTIGWPTPLDGQHHWMANTIGWPTPLDGQDAAKESELQTIPLAATSSAAALGVISSAIQQRRDLMSGVISGRYGSFQSDEEMHYAARLHERFNKFEAEMREALPNFLGKEYTERCKEALKEVAGISLPNMLDQVVVGQLVQEVVDSIEGLCLLLVNDCFAYPTEVQQAVASHACGIYPGTASLTNLISNDDQAARDLQINMFSYANVMHKRLCDAIPVEIRMCLETSLLDDTDTAVWREIHGGDISKIAALKAVDQQRRARLEESIKRLKASEATLLGLAFDTPMLLA